MRQEKKHYWDKKMFIQNILYIILALFGIGFLVFIHELGHYFMARRVGIIVEVFAIGFGKPIYEWEHKGVKWKIGWLPFGGYVKMAGTEKKGSLEPYQIPGGFFSKRPIDRIKVAAMGPIVNITFAFLAFTLLWALGGREKNFAEYSHYVGWVDHDSPLHTQAHVKAGDEILTLNEKHFKGLSDLLYAAVLEKKNPEIKGYLIDYDTGNKSPFAYTFPNDSHLKGMEKAKSMLSNFGSASYLIYDRMPNGKENPLQEGSPIASSGIQYKDRILWMDGELIFSKDQLGEVLNEPKVMLTIQRDGQTFLTRIPRLKVSEIKFSRDVMDEIHDWQYESKIDRKFNDLFFIPYNLNAAGIVENPVAYIDEKSKVKQLFIAPVRSSSEFALQSGDKIIAVDGMPVTSGYQILEKLQQRRVNIIVQKMQEHPLYSWKEADKHFEQSFPLADLHAIESSIGTERKIQESGSLRLLNPIMPVHMNQFPLKEADRIYNEQKKEEQKKNIEKIADPKKRESVKQEFENYQKRLMLGITLQDALVRFNPTPFALFGNVFQETYRTLISLVTGQLSPKMISGPVGIVQVIHYGWMVGVKEVLYWLAVISLNLGIFNLMPIPVLDGGYICFSIAEMVTKKPIKAKTMERLIIPFVVLLILAFIYLTYNDISRLLGKFF